MDPQINFHFPSTDPQFLTHVFNSLLPLQQDHPLARLFDLKEEVQLSALFDISGIQESFQFRALHRARRLSQALIDERGDVNRELLQQLIALYEKEGYLFFPGGTNDGVLCEHVLRTLRALSQESLIKSLKRFQNPLAHKWAEKLIYETLGLASNGSPSDIQVRTAVLCACLTPLRQNVGSCFATAPAILIQSEQISLLLDDLHQLLTTGKLKRTFGGVEYAIPLSPSTGIGDLKKNLLSIDAPNKAWLSPGLMAALEKVGILDSKQPLEEKGNLLKVLINDFSAGKSVLTAEELIRQSLLRKFSLSESDIEKGRSLELAQVKAAKMGSSAPDMGSLRHLDKLVAFQLAEKEARATFKAICGNSLLKAWEFTIASFSEVKMEFSRWNLYSSLGLSPQEPGGIGELIYARIDEKITELNQKLQEYQTQYEIAFDQVRATEALLRNASSESDARRLQAEYQSRAYHMRSCLEVRDAAYTKGSNYSNLFSFLVKQYDKRFPEYFQEIYDAEMQDFQGEIYDDSPAGFRLVYKHGRADPSLWTLIYNAEQYIDSLLDFFTATETQIASECSWEGGERDVLDLTAAIVGHIRTEAFLTSALKRMAKAHQSPLTRASLADLQSLEKKPWAYTSGGTMTTLLKTYFCREGELTQEEKWVENESELLIFILDTLKSLPPKITDPYLRDPSKAMLMTSPTHAFLLLPAHEKFRKGWQEDIFTYTWVRDEMFLPSQRFYAEMRLGTSEQDFLLTRFCDLLPPTISHYLSQTLFPKEKKLSIAEWRSCVLNVFLQHAKEQKKARKQDFADALDAFLYQNLPLFHAREWKIVVRRIFSDLMSEKVEQVLQRFPDQPSLLVTARDICDAAKACYLLAENKITLPFDLDLYVANHARFVGAAPPTPLLFADTNWAGNYFGFVVNPGTGRLELWRLDRTLSRGVQMSPWKQWLNGSDPKTWSIFTRPYEYEMSSSFSGMKL